jgi:hypothetical protein
MKGSIRVFQTAYTMSGRGTGCVRWRGSLALRPARRGKPADRGIEASQFLAGIYPETRASNATSAVATCL